VDINDRVYIHSVFGQALLLVSALRNILISARIGKMLNNVAVKSTQMFAKER